MSRTIVLLAVFLFACEHAAPAVDEAREASLHIVVPDTLAAVGEVTRKAEAAGGYVTASTIWREGDATHATVIVRIPREKLTSTLAALRSGASRVDCETIRVVPRSHAQLPRPSG